MASTEKPKPPPPPTLARLAAESLIETIDGPAPIVKLVGKSTPVATRLPDGRVGFRMMSQVREVEAEAEILRVRSEDGGEALVGAGHVFLRAGGGEVRAGELRPGDRLEALWSYPEGYRIPDEEGFAPRLRGQVWTPGVVVAACERAGRGPLYGASVRETKCFLLSFGALSRAQE